LEDELTMLLNQDKIYQLNTDMRTLPWVRNNDDRSYVNNRNNDDADYWLIQFTDKNSFKIYPVELLVPPDVLTRIKNKEIFLILDNAYEGFLNVIDTVYEDVIEKYNIPHEQVILVSGNYDMLPYMESYARETNKPKIKIDYFNFWEWNIIGEYRATRQPFIPTLQKNEYDKKFLCLNRRWRPARCLLLAMLYERNLIDKGHVSFKDNLDQTTWESAVLGVHSRYNDPLITELMNNTFSSIKSILPLNLDNVALAPTDNHHFLIYPGINSYYVDTYFSVVTDVNTNRHIEGRFLTEKIFKPIALRHPFIVWGADKTLEALRLLGYKTFEGIIDESYDNESNEITRVNMIVNEIERLSNLTGSELENFLIKAQEICFYNYIVFRNRDMTKFEYVHRMNY